MVIFLIVRPVLVVSASVLDENVVEQRSRRGQASKWVRHSKSTALAAPSAAAGTAFTCAATDDAGTVWTVHVAVNADSTVD